MLKKIANFGDLKRYINSVDLPDNAEILFRNEEGFCDDIVYGCDPYFDREPAEMIKDNAALEVYAKEYQLAKEELTEIKRVLMLGYLDSRHLDAWVKSEG